jgi:DNA-binding NarL/FixJ family response regulator
VGPKPNPVRILVAEGHAMVLEGIKRTLTNEPTFSIVGATTETSHDALVHAVADAQPHVLIRGTGPLNEAVARSTISLKEHHAGLGILTLCTEVSLRAAVRLAKAGCTVMFKSCNAETLTDAVDTVARGHVFGMQSLAKYLKGDVPIPELEDWLPPADDEDDNPPAAGIRQPR